MIVNTTSNSSPPLRGRGLLADDDKSDENHNHNSANQDINNFKRKDGML